MIRTICQCRAPRSEQQIFCVKQASWSTQTAIAKRRETTDRWLEINLLDDSGELKAWEEPETYKILCTGSCESLRCLCFNTKDSEGQRVG
jgi:hypothetical protein